MKKQKIVEIGNATDKGRVREINEDYFAFYTLDENFIIAIVCDGMGGHNAGEVASNLAVEEIAKHFNNPNNLSSIIDELKNALVKANDRIFQIGNSSNSQKGMGTTVVALVVKNDFAYHAHVGDSRLYLIRASKISQLTKDNSYVQELIEKNLITKDEAQKHPKRNVILKALGISNTLEPELSKPIPTFKDDHFVLCTDGLTEYLTENEIRDYVESYRPNVAAKKLIQLANKRGGKDNITVQVIKIKNGNHYSKSLLENLRTILLSYWFAISLLIGSLACFFLVFFMEKNDTGETINQKITDKIEQVNNIDSTTSKKVTPPLQDKDTTKTLENSIHDTIKINNKDMQK